MGKLLARAVTTSALAVIAASALSLAPVAATAAGAAAEEGKKIAFDRRKGNCLACHMMADGNLPGNIGPPLIAIKARFPDRDALRAQIFDATVKNPNSLMPPFGRNGILSEAELDKVVEFVLSL